MNNETLERLRLPAAWVLIGAVGAGVLAGFIRLIAGSGYPGSFASALGGAGGNFFGLSVVVLLAAAVLLVLTSERTRPAAFGVVLTALIFSGLGLLFALINLITEFIAASEIDAISLGFAGFLSTLGQGAVLGIFAFALLKAFNDPNLVPRATPQAQTYGGYPQAYGQPGYQDPTMTGGQPAADPAQAVPGQAQQQAAYDPNQYGQAQVQQHYATGAQQSYAPQQSYDTSGQQAQAYDASQTQQPQAGYDANPYGQTQVQPQYGTGAQQSYGQAQYGTDASGQQPAYDPNQYGQAQQQYGTDTSGQAQPQAGYDANPYGQTQVQPQYGTDASGQQQGYGQAYDPSQYAPQQGEQPASGEQAAQDAINYGWYGQGQAQGQPSESGVEPFFNSGENNATETTDQGGSGYGDQYGSGSGYGSDQQGQGGTGGQQGWYGGEGQR
ncbi:hypothetical protein ABZ249_03610 [Nocardiopsis sp. NPDC006139]|uniref:hypothetical protein n=1 Tax=Nocardiopsis TaxID=2013 RepID=UPI0033B115D5